jgi:hypothetical protein
MKTLQELLTEFQNSEIGKIKQNQLETATIRRKVIYQFNSGGKLLKTWKSANEIITNGFHYSTILRGLKSNRATICKGSVWSYSKNIDITNLKVSGNRKYVLGDIVVTDMNDNILSICKSTKEVSEKYGIHEGGIRRVLSGKYKQTNNYKMFFNKISS